MLVLPEAPMSDLHDRIAKTLGWSTRDVQSLSMQSLHDLVRPDPVPPTSCQFATEIQSM